MTNISLIGKWCILRVSGPATLPLCRSLVAAGIDAWTPTMTSRRRRVRSTETIEVRAPIVPTFVFAPACRLNDLLAIRGAQISPHPAFSILRCGDQAALVREGQLSPLRTEEAILARAYEDLLREEAEAEAEATAKAERVALLRTEQARRKALKAERRAFRKGAAVAVSAAPAFAGMTGVVQTGNGRNFTVQFGGRLSIKIEAWQLLRSDVDSVPLPTA